MTKKIKVPDRGLMRRIQAKLNADTQGFAMSQEFMDFSTQFAAFFQRARVWDADAREYRSTPEGAWLDAGLHQRTTVPT